MIDRFVVPHKGTENLIRFYSTVAVALAMRILPFARGPSCRYLPCRSFDHTVLVQFDFNDAHGHSREMCRRQSLVPNHNCHTVSTFRLLQNERGKTVGASGSSPASTTGISLLLFTGLRGEGIRTLVAMKHHTYFHISDISVL